MPEGDTLARLADRLRPVLEGNQLTATDFRVPRLATLDLSGRTVDRVTSRGKYLLVRAGDLTVLSHLKMEGSWEAYPLVDADGRAVVPRWRHPGWQARCVLQTSGHQVVGFSLGLLEVVPSGRVGDRLGFLGPDLLDPDWADSDRAAALLAEAVHRLSEDPDRPIGLALLDQRLVAGIGNVYRCEILLLAGLDPHRPVSTVPDLAGLVGLARDLLHANVVPGAPAQRVTTCVVPDPDRPYGIRVVPPSGAPRRDRRVPTAFVYRREREGCLRCRGPVRQEDWTDPRDAAAGPRQLWWCRHCQQ